MASSHNNVVELYSDGTVRLKHVEHLKRPIVKYYTGNTLTRTERISLDGNPFDGYGEVSEGGVCFWGELHSFHAKAIAALKLQ